MTNRNKNLASEQADIFQRMEMPNEQRDVDQPFDVDATWELRGACATAMKLAERRGISRDRLVDEMNRWLPNLERKITKAKIYAWMAESKVDHPMPAYVIPALCKATKCNLPMKALAAMLDLDLSDSLERMAQELGEAELKRAAAAREIKALKNRFSEG